MSTALLLLGAATTGCGSDDGGGLRLRAITFNTGTTEGLAHDTGPDDGYTSEHAAWSDTWYGDGLAWIPAVEAARAFLAEAAPELIAFQEIFHSPTCADIPAEVHGDFVCSRWRAGDPTVAQEILGPSYQVACHLEKSDKCIAVRRDFGQLRGCDAELCLDGLDGARVPDCGGGSRVGRGVIELASGGELTVVSVHGSSGIEAEDRACRVAQFEQIFVDLGDGAPGANGARNIILGDFNTDPGRATDFDESAERIHDFVGEDQPFAFISEVGPDAPGAYGDFFDIDHVISDAFRGDCAVAGLAPEWPALIDAVYFDHRPVICELRE